MWNSVSLLVGIVFLLAGRIQPSLDKKYILWKKHTLNSPIIFLTDITAHLSTIYFLIGLFLVISEYLNVEKIVKSHIYRKIRVFYKKHLPFLLILNSTVTLGFWGLYLCNKNLLAVKVAGIAYRVPFWKNFCDHSIGLVVTILEIIFHNFKFTPYTIYLTLGCTVLYYTDICVYNYLYNVWPYGILNNLSKPMIFICCLCFLTAGCILAFFILRIIRFFKKADKKERFDGISRPLTRFIDDRS